MNRVRRAIMASFFSFFTVAGLAGLAAPTSAQVSVKCWREYCARDPETGAEYCVKETIPCPPEEERTQTP